MRDRSLPLILLLAVLAFLGTGSLELIPRSGSTAGNLGATAAGAPAGDRSLSRDVLPAGGAVLSAPGSNVGGSGSAVAPGTRPYAAPHVATNVRSTGRQDHPDSSLEAPVNRGPPRQAGT